MFQSRNMLKLLCIKTFTSHILRFAPGSARSDAKGILLMTLYFFTITQMLHNKLHQQDNKSTVKTTQIRREFK